MKARSFSYTPHFVYYCCVTSAAVNEYWKMYQKFIEPCQRQTKTGKANSSHLFIPNVPRHGPPTSSPVQVNLGKMLFGYFTGISPANRVRNATTPALSAQSVAAFTPSATSELISPARWWPGTIRATADDFCKAAIAVASARFFSCGRRWQGQSPFASLPARW